MPRRSERDRMLAGQLYRSGVPDLVEARRRAKRLCHSYNQSSESDPQLRRDILGKLLGRIGRPIEIEPPFFCDYGANIRAGDNLYMNTGCVLLDCAPITIGRNVLIGPGVHIYAATHPVDPAIRRTGRELASPVTIGDDVWIGGGAIICPGVTVARGSVVGAGSVVTRDVPPGCVVAGNPARVLRSIAKSKAPGNRPRCSGTSAT